MKAVLNIGRIIGLVLSFGANAQIDTEFWFAAPEITALHADRPIYLFVTSFDQSGTIKVMQPANATFETITQNIGVNSTIRIDLTTFIDELENTPADQILNKGLLITSTVPVTAYYEVFGSGAWAAGVNSDLFALKGNHALGVNFYIPFQTHWDNNPSVDGWASFDIVATENNTVVTITPTTDLVGHVAGVPFSITLQRGQTYSARANSTLAVNRPAGSHVTSTKPIAITTKDDSMYDAPNYDTAGDQLIPVEVTGTKYLVTGVSNIGNDRVYILATEANTQLFLDGASVPAATLNAGQQHELQLLNPTVYLESSAPVYVFHVTGFDKELGGALLPPLQCTGSKQVSVTRSTVEDFYLLLICETGDENSFFLNGSSTAIVGSNFQTVSGTSGAWKFQKLSLDNTSYPAGSTIIIKNTSGNFHLGICNGASSTGFRYGYFSDYGFLELGSAKSFCKGDSIQLSAGPFLDSYSWTFESNEVSTTFFTIAKDTGTYYVTATKGACSFEDSVDVQFLPEVTLPILGEDTANCKNLALKILPLQNYSSYLWSTGSRSKSLINPDSGKYWIRVTNSFGCKNSDTILIDRYPVPQPTILYNSEKSTYCRDSIVELSADKVYSTYLWFNGATTNSIEVAHTSNDGRDKFWLEVTNSFECKNRTTLEVDCSTEIGMIPNLITANGDSLNDVFYIADLKPGRWTLEVYNRWGERVYINKAYSNNWYPYDFEEGVYYFLLKHNDYSLENKGWVHIMKH